MVKAYSRYTDSGVVGRIHSDAVGQTVVWSEDGKSLYSCTGTSVVEISTKTGSIINSVACVGEKDIDEGLHTSALAIKQPVRATCISISKEYLGIGCSDGSALIVVRSNLDEHVALFQGHRGPVNSIAFSEDGNMVITGGRDTELVLWDIVSGSGVCRFKGHKGEVTKVLFLEFSETSAMAPTTQYVVSSSKDGLIKIWSSSLQICVQTLTDSKSEVWSLCVWGSRLIAGSSDKALYVYDLVSCVASSSGVIARFTGSLARPESGDGKVAAIAVCNGILFAQSDRRVVEMWRFVDSEEERRKRQKRRLKRASLGAKDDHPTENLNDIVDVADDIVVSSEAVPSVVENLFRASDEFVWVPSPENPAVALRYIANGRIKSMGVLGRDTPQIALGLGDNQIELFKVGCEVSGKTFIKESRMIAKEGHRQGVTSVCVAPNNATVVSASGCGLIVWNAVTLAFQRTVNLENELRGSEILAIFFASQRLLDTVVVVAKNGLVCLVSLGTGAVQEENGVLELWPMEDLTDESGEGQKMSKKPKKLNQEVKCVSVLYDQGSVKLVLACKPSRVIIVDILCEEETGGVSLSVGATYGVPDDPVSLAVSSSGKYIGIGLINCNIEVIFMDTGKHALSLYAHKLPVTALEFSPDEQILVSGSVDKNIKVWSLKFGNVLKSIRAHDNTVTLLKFIPYTHLVWSGARDGVISLWDVDRFERVMSKVVHQEVLCMGISKDAGMVFTGGSDRLVNRLTRSGDQMFIEEELEKAMELEVDGEAQREDLRVKMEDTPTKSSLQSVRLVEKVIEMIEIDEQEMEPKDVLLKKIELVKFIAQGVPPAQLQQVVISLPTGHARRLLAVIADVLGEIRLKDNSIAGGHYPSGFPIESCVSASLFLIQAQAKYLISEPHSRQVLLRLKTLFHEAIDQEIENVGIASASIRLL